MVSRLPALRLSVRQEINDFRAHVIEHFEQIMLGVEDFKNRIRMAGGKLLRVANRDDVVVRAVEDEGRLREVGVGLKALAIGENLVAEFPLSVLGVMKNIEGAFVTPGGHGSGAEAIGPSFRESESRREQHQALDLRVAGGVERGEVATKTGTDERDWLARHRLIDDSELAGDGEVLEVAAIEIGGVDRSSGGFQQSAEISGFRGLGSRSKAVEVDNAVHLGALKLMVELELKKRYGS